MLPLSDAYLSPVAFESKVLTTPLPNTKLAKIVNSAVIPVGQKELYMYIYASKQGQTSSGIKFQHHYIKVPKYSHSLTTTVILYLKPSFSYQASTWIQPFSGY